MHQPAVKLLSRNRMDARAQWLETGKNGRKRVRTILSRGIRERRKRKQVQAVARVKPADIFLVVHRVDYFVYFRRVTAEEFHLLQALDKGKSLGQAVAASFGKQKKGASADPALVTKWFQNWASLGWFRAA